jgi:hypothetical protein
MHAAEKRRPGRPRKDDDDTPKQKSRLAELREKIKDEQKTVVTEPLPSTPVAEIPPKPQPKPDDEIPQFGVDECNMVLDALSLIEPIAASRIYGIPREITTKAFEFDDYHRKKLHPPMTRVLNKWAPLLLAKWKDEIGLGIVFLSVTNAQIRTMHALDEKRRRNLPTPKVTSIEQKSEPKTELQSSPTEKHDVLENVGFNI